MLLHFSSAAKPLLFLFQLVFMVLKLQHVSASRSPPFVLFVDHVLMCTGQNVKLSSQKGENVN